MGWTSYSYLAMSTEVLWATILWATVALQALSSSPPTRLEFADVLNASAESPDFFVLSDLGAWHGVALASTPLLAVAGPFIHGGPGFVAETMVNLLPRVVGASEGGSFVYTSQHLFPGMLLSQATSGTVNATMETIFVSSRSSATRFSLRNTGATAVSLGWDVVGSLTRVASANVTAAHNSVFALLGGTDLISSPRIVVSFSPSLPVIISAANSAYKASSIQPMSVLPNSTVDIHVVMTYCLNASEMAAEASVIQEYFADPSSAYIRNAKRWQQYISAVASKATAQKAWLAVKAVVTLVTNWRSAAGPFLHDGLYPSFLHYQGFWAWVRISPPCSR